MQLARPSSIHDLEVFAGCTRAQVRAIESLTTLLHLDEGHVLMREGTPAKEFIVIESGTATVTRQAPHGVVTLAEVGRGDFLGEMGLLSGSLRTATVTATTPLTVLVSSAGEFRTMLRVAPSVAHKVHRASLLRTESLVPAA
jgi:CRP-like cAMP-binding protein